MAWAIMTYVILKNHGDLFDEKYRLNYQYSENVNTVTDIKNNIIRECLKYFKIDEPLYISTIADIIARTGWRFVVVGDGPYRHELEIRYPTVEFVGRCDPISYYHEASILIVSSIGYDNFPTVILEGMRHGLCVVGNRIGGISEMVKDGQTGLLYQSQESLQEQIEKLIADGKALQQLGRAARTSFDRNYLWDKCYDKYFNLYQAVINNG